MDEGEGARNRCDENQVANEWKDKIAVAIKEEQENYIQAYTELYQYVKDQICRRVLEKCQSYVKGLIDNYEAFYDSFGEMLTVLRKKKRFGRTSWTAIRGFPNLMSVRTVRAGKQFLKR